MSGFEYLDSGAMTGAFNMEFDVARAHAVSDGSLPPLLRVYRWNPWCVSLGRHQSERDLDVARIARDGFHIVRRPTGGRAILHAEELTYSVIMPHGNRGILEIYKMISEALVAGLHLLAPGIEMARSQPDFQKLYKEPGGIPCFSSSARYEIEYGGRKLVGSAQRRIGGAVLQHGSLLLGDAHLRLADYLAVDRHARRDILHDMSEHTVTLAEIAGRAVPYAEVADCIRRGFERSWDISLTLVSKIDYIVGRK